MTIETNVFKTSTSGASYVAPDKWSKKLQESLRDASVFERLGRQDFRGMGMNTKAIYIPKNAWETASEVTEGSGITVSALSYSQISITFKTYGQAFQVTMEQEAQGYTWLMNDVIARARYALVDKKDQVIRDALYGGSGILTYSANGDTGASFTSADVIDVDDVIMAQAIMKANKSAPRYFIIHPYQEAAVKKIMASSNYQFNQEKIIGLNGDRSIGNLFGSEVIVTNYISTAAYGSGTAYKSLFLDQGAFAVAYNKLATLRIGEDSVTDLAKKVAAYERYGVGILEPKKILVLYTAVAE